MPVDRSPELLERALKSLLEQTDQNFQLVLIDDANGRISKSVLDLIEAFSDPVIIHTDGLGVTEALLQGAELATGEIIMRHDADDTSTRSRVEQTKAFFAENPDVDFAASATTLINISPFGETSTTTTPPSDSAELGKELRSANPLVHGSVTFTRDIYTAAGGYDAKYPVRQDYQLWIKFLELGATFRPITENHYVYNVWPGSVSHERRELCTRIEKKLSIVAQRLGRS